MKNQVVHLREMPRKLLFAPRVRSVGCFTALQLPHRQRVEGVQFCYRFYADSNWIQFDHDGHTRGGGFPQFLVKRPGEWVETDSEAKLDVFWVSFDDAELPWFRERGLPDDLTISELNLSARQLALIRDLQELCTHSAEPGAADRIDLLALELTAETLLKIEEERSPNSRPEREISRIASWLQLHFSDEIDFDELAGKHGFSRRSFFRHWNNCHAETPAQYVARLRLEEARRLLCNTTWSIGRIALTLGYNSETYFSGVFRKSEHQTPTEYRKRGDRILPT